MPLDSDTLDALAFCLEYPGPATAVRARSAAERCAGDHIALARALWHLAVALETARPGEAEERYTALFDLDPVCTLHVGYHVFGDTYARGEFLARLAPELKRAGVDAGLELPDFLPNLLRLLARLPDPDDAGALAETALLPALEQMGASLGETRSPWSDLVRALPDFLAEGVGLPPSAPPPLAHRDTEVAADA